MMMIIMLVKMMLMVVVKMMIMRMIVIFMTKTMTMIMILTVNAKLTSTFVDVPNKISILQDQRKYWPQKTPASN